MSSHEVNIVEIKDIVLHPNADKLEIVKIDGWTIVVRRGDFKVGDTAIYIPPDYVVDTSIPELSFLAETDKRFVRTRAKKFRGCLSFGVLIPVPERMRDLPVGSNVIDNLNITRYEPPIPPSTRGMLDSSPKLIVAPKFDIESFQKYHRVLVDGEAVVVTEKLHGTNSRFVFASDSDGEYRMFVGSRTSWMKKDDKNLYWRAIAEYPSIEEWCKANPDHILYGEIFGQVQNLKYGATQNQIFFAAFAVMVRGEWMDHEVMQSSLGNYGVTTAPVVYTGPYSFDLVLSLAENDSVWPGANHYAEGVVVKPTRERSCAEIGRVILKAVGSRYLSGDGK